MPKISHAESIIFLRRQIIIPTLKISMVKIMKLLKIFLTGAFGYGFLEIIWRGYTHPTMLFAGGICLLLIYGIAVYFRRLSIFKKSLLGAAAITAVELIIGVTVNIGMHMNVWDYSNLPFNIGGQISLLYSFLWFLLSAVIIKIFEFFERRKAR